MKNDFIAKKAILHALLAVGYIACVALLMSQGEKIFVNVPDILAGVSMLMLFTLSASVMGLLFFGKPAMLYVDGKKKEAIQMLAYTVGSFAFATVVMFSVIAMLYVSLSR